jgi:hypothetical protein
MSAAARFTAASIPFANEAESPRSSMIAPITISLSADTDPTRRAHHNIKMQKTIFFINYCSIVTSGFSASIPDSGFPYGIFPVFI